MPTRFAHTNIVSEDCRKLVSFYQLVFECQIIPPWREQSGDWLAEGTGLPGPELEGMRLRLPGHGEHGPTLQIYQYKRMEDRLAPAANRKGISHIAFDVDDVAAVRGKVLANGGADLGRIARRDLPHRGTITFVYMTDPEGNILELQKSAG